MSLLKLCLASIPDHRRAQGRMYDLPHLMLFSILAVASGATSYRKIQQFIATHGQRLNAAFGCQWRRPPAYTSIRYVFQGLDAAEVERAFRDHAAGLNEVAPTSRPHITFDGKTLRGSLDRFEDQKAAQVLSALASHNHLVLGHILIEDADKDHEIQAAQRLIEELGLTGCLFTLDALHCQKKTVEVALATDNDLLVQLKANPPSLYEAVRAHCAAASPAEEHSSCDLGKRNRLESRHGRLWHLPPGTASQPWHDHFPLVLEVIRHTECFQTARKRFEPRREQPTDYLCTLRASAGVLGEAIRSHWGIENRLHYVLDVALEEDACRIRRNPGLFALVRHFALNLLRFNGKANIKATLYDNALSLDRLLAYKGI